MYKSKLQELCQKRTWELPSYEASKQGEDHNPRFLVTVTVNGISFHSPSPCNSSKKAQSDAAKLALDHFSSSSSLPDMQRLDKNQLQTYAQKRNLALPVYSCERVGPPHASRFKCMVTVNGQTFESLEYFPTVNKAEQAAAKAALMSLLPNGVEEDESAYKNLLQELAQREGCGLPTYSTDKSGKVHAPTFFSTVEIGGKSFTGQGAKTKKQAEISAAKIAYTALKQCHSSPSPAILSPACQVQEAPQSFTLLTPACQAQKAVQSTCLSPARQGQEAPQFSTSSFVADLTSYLQQNIQPKLPVPSEQAEEDRACPEVSSHQLSIASPGLDSGSSVKCIAASAVTNIASSTSVAVSYLPKPDPPSSSLPSDSSTSLAASLNIEHLFGKCTSRGIRNIVHPRGTKMTYPAGSNVVISDDKWVAVKLAPQPSQ